MKAVVLAAGKGKRMRGLCSTLPKPMLPIANRPIVTVTLDRLRSMGIEELGLVVGHEQERLRSLLGSAPPEGPAITYIAQDRPLGTGHAVALCEDFVAGQPFALMWGDVLAHGANYPRVADRFDQGDCEAVLTVIRVPDASTTAAVDVDRGFVTGITEKPPLGSRPNAFANAGIFIWPPAIFDTLRGLQPSPRGEYEFTDAILRFVQSKAPIAALELQGYRENVTSPESCVRANELLLGEVLPSPPVDPPGTAGSAESVSGCRIAHGALIYEGCTLRQCTLGQDCAVGPRASLERVEIQAGATVEPGCTLGPLVSVGEGAVVRAGARLGPNVSVGPGCVVGADAQLANAILLPGSTVGDAAAVEWAMLDAGVELDAGRKLAGSANEVREVLKT